MTLALSIDRTLALARRVVVPLLVLLLMLPALAGASGSSPGDAGADDTEAPPSGSTFHPSGSGPPGPTPGVPSPEELEAAGAVIGEVVIDNQNIFNLEDPKDDNWAFRAADALHPKTHTGRPLQPPADR